jgi:hypothetical protein
MKIETETDTVSHSLRSRMTSLDSDEELITLISRDNTKHTISRNNAYISGLIKVSLEDDPEEHNIQLDISKEMLVLVDNYLSLKKGDKTITVCKPVRPDFLDTCNCKWERDYIKKLTKEQLFELIHVANALDIAPLMCLVGAFIAVELRDKPSMKERREYLDIKNE